VYDPLEDGVQTGLDAVQALELGVYEGEHEVGLAVLLDLVGDLAAEGVVVDEVGLERGDGGVGEVGEEEVHGDEVAKVGDVRASPGYGD